MYEKEATTSSLLQNESVSETELMEMQRQAASQAHRVVEPGISLSSLLTNILDDDNIEDKTEEDLALEKELYAAPTSEELETSLSVLQQGLAPANHSEEEALDSLLHEHVDAGTAVESLRLEKKRVEQQKNDSASTAWAITDRIDTTNFKTDLPHPALTYPFELDSFQKEAILHLENNECVFVAAHTSAGKTVVAEYAVALAMKHMTRAVYTSPIKALSNQKFREFRNKFGKENVGLITGDVSINPSGACLIMTTEILRSMLYRGADLVRDIEWVIFDEIHYVNDTERGVVYEETLIMLPSHINIIFLSATTPNTFEFSDWVGRTKKKRVHVITTTTRPVPLQHYMYVKGECVKIMDSKGVFLAAGHSLAMKKVRGLDEKDKGKPKGKGQPVRRKVTSSGDKNQWTKCIKVLESGKLLPAVVFAFSKRLCEECTSKLSSLDLCTTSEKHEITVFLSRSIQRLHGSDQHLPQVLQLQEMCTRGIGLHHSGLLPILKEMVEILFSRGLIKVLFATETFAMGVNMPARTVLFNGIRKHDGTRFRNLHPGEYTQMAGRAGRRGLDSVGTVILAVWNEDSAPEVQGCHTMMKGTPTRLTSQFRLTYTMILNLLRVEDLTVEEMIKRSFSEFGTQRELALKDISGLITKTKKMLCHVRKKVEDETCIKGGEMDIEDYYRNDTQMHNTSLYIHEAYIARFGIGTVLPPGRIVIGTVLSNTMLGVILKSEKQADMTTYLMTILFLCPASFVVPKTTSNIVSNEKKSRLDNKSFGASMGKQNKMEKVEDVASTNLERNVVQTCLWSTFVILENLPLSTLRVIGAGKASAASEVAKAVEGERVAGISASLTSTVRSLSALTVDTLEPLELKVQDLQVVEAQSYLVSRQTLQRTSKCHDCSQQSVLWATVEKISKLENHLSRLQHAASASSLVLFPAFLQRLQVLESLGYITPDRTVQIKGRVACEINTCDELILTELIFENVLSPLEPEEIVALLSAFIFQERRYASEGDDLSMLPASLQAARETILQLAEALVVVQLEAYIDIDPIEYLSTVLNFGLVHVVYEWAKGMPFQAICTLTEVQEGAIVRCITRLDEVCREVSNVSRIIGDPRLFRKMEIASECIKRDVVFATSLYLS